MSKNILIIEDDKKISELLELNLKDLSYTCHCEFDGQEGLDEAMRNEYDLILLDLNLPSKNGIEVCQSIRSKNKKVPIVMITAKTEEIDKVIGLDSGADDYITKPFSVRELQARIRAILRRFESEPEKDKAKTLLSPGNLQIDIDKRILKKYNERIELTPKEFDLLAFLAGNPGKSFKRENLLNLVWGYDFVGIEHTVNSHINRLRSKIEDDVTKPAYILTTWGYGYRFNEEL